MKLIQVFLFFFPLKMTTYENIALDFLIDFSKDIEKLLISSNRNHSDVKIQAGEEPNVKEFSSHSLILSSRSPRLERDLWEMKLNKYVIDDKDRDVVVIKISNISSKIFEIILRYMYTAMIDLDALDGMDIL